MANGIYSTLEETKENLLQNPNFIVDFCSAYANMIVGVFAEIPGHRDTLSAAFSGIFQPLEEQAISLNMPESHAKLWSYLLKETAHMGSHPYEEERAQDFITTVQGLACKASVDLMYPDHNLQDIDAIKTLMHLQRSSST